MAHPQNSESAPSSRSSNKLVFLTLFPEVFPPVLSSSLLGKAAERGLVSYETVQIRDFATDKHRTVDDTPFGGGEGMVMKADVLKAAWLHAGGAREGARTIFVSPQGRLLDQPLARELSRERELIVVCGHYEGVDERFIEECVDDEVSIGDYVLTGGELPALVLADAVVRLIPGVVGNERSLSEESLENGLLKYPQYTRPRELEGRAVPEVLLSGDHKAIERWRAFQMEERTKRKRPDLWTKIISRSNKSGISSS
jgi:tRNA (guanine37-N1)-methyltransferase